MNERALYDADSEAVQTHLTILQDIIRRMAGNSASCKNWCILLVAAILVLVARTDTTDYALLALLPTLFFLLLDAYYLALEQTFRNSYNAFVSKLHRGDVCLSDLYAVSPGGRVGRQLLVSLRSKRFGLSILCWWWQCCWYGNLRASECGSVTDHSKLLTVRTLDSPQHAVALALTLS